ncbi:hypothetical protein GCM10022419_133000 [Nonomuraea rosea]|uniref:Uncharacterized protein n=1 Tax=Nonomuraea rosea TaxID=638574 RepID=A0ABP7A4I1_9ACTN
MREDRADALDPASGTAGAGVAPIVEERGEQGRVTGDPAGPLGDGQGRVLVFQQLPELVAHRRHRGQHAQLVRAHPYGKGVHERAGHAVGTQARVHPAEQHGPEDHVGPAADGGERTGPGHVHHGRGAHAHAERGVTQPCGEFRGKAELFPRHSGAVAARVHQPVRRRRLPHVAQQPGEVPRMFVHLGPAAGLCHEGAERQRLGQRVAVPGEERLHLVEQDFLGRVVLHHVVDAEQGQPPAVAARPGGRVHPDQRGAGQVHR